MPDRREILLRNVKCAAAREGFISFHFPQSGKFHNPEGIIAHFAPAKYFTYNAPEYFYPVTRFSTATAPISTPVTRNTPAIPAPAIGRACIRR